MDSTPHRRVSTAPTRLRRLAAAAATARTAGELSDELAGALREALGADHVHVAGEARAQPAERYDVGSTQFVPIGPDGEDRRLAVVSSPAPRELTPAETAEAQALAALAAAGFARLDAAERGTARDRALVRAAAALSTAEGLEERLRALADEAAAAVGAAHAAFHLGDAAADDTFTVPVVFNGEVEGALSLEWTTTRPVHKEDRRTLEAIAALAAVAIGHDSPQQTHSQSLQVGSAAGLEALAASIEQRDGYTREHSERVVYLARGVAMILGLAGDQVERIGRAALLHDIGKLAVPDHILHKSGPLSPDEWELMAEHPVAGERILLRSRDLAAIAPIVRHEHEHWNGSGYPDGLVARQIPVGSRIVLACDAYQAMISDRAYRGALSPADAVAELQRGAGRQFDPDVVDALLDLLGYAAGSRSAA